jgi:hypothetical protein
MSTEHLVDIPNELTSAQTLSQEKIKLELWLELKLEQDEHEERQEEKGELLREKKTKKLKCVGNEKSLSLL